MKEVQAFVTNISFPKSLDEFLYYIEDGVDKVFNKDNLRFHVDIVLKEKSVKWTAPKWSKKNDIVFFMHAKSALSIITKLRTEYYNTKDNYTIEQRELIEEGIDHALYNYNKYGGKIFAIGRVIGSPYYDNSYKNESKQHYKSKISARISDIIVLKNPIDISEFNDFIFVSRQSPITGVFGKEFKKLKNLILSKNKTKKYFRESISAVLPIKNINKKNWLQLSNDYRRDFFLESQFRSYYVDYLLKKLTDSKVYKECSCKSKNKPDCFIDNVITFNKIPLLVEIKLNINSEKDLPNQMNKYCNCNKVLIGNKLYSIKDCYNKIAIIIDTNNIYIFNNKTKKIFPIIALDKIKNANDIKKIKTIINKYLNSCK